MKQLGIVLAWALISRYVTGIDTTDTQGSQTVIDILVGTGSYAEVTRDCNGNAVSVKNFPYTEFGISASHTFSDLKLGLAVGVTDSRRSASSFSSNGAAGSSIPYVAPQIGFSTKYVGLSVGYLFDLSSPATEQPVPGPFQTPPATDLKNGTPIGELRVGREDKAYFYTGYGMNTPFSVGNGVIDIGVGFGFPNTNSRFCLGLGAIPDDGLMISAKGDIAVSDHLAICLRGHVAPGDGFGYGAAGGIKVRF